jgi:hypothetical protein
VEQNGWLKVYLEKMAGDICYIKDDVRSLRTDEIKPLADKVESLREDRAKRDGTIVAISVIGTIVFNLLAIWLKS